MGALNNLVATVWPAVQAARSALSFQGRSVEPIAPQSRIVYLPRSDAGVRVSADEALRISAVWACISVVSKALAASTWEVFEEDRGGNRQLRRDTRTWRLLNVAPNPEMTAFAFKQAGVINRYLWGNFFAEIERTLRGDVAALWPLPTERCVLERGTDDQLQVRVMNHTRPDTILRYRDVLHWHGPSFDGIEGLNTIAYAARSLGHAAALDIFASTFFGNGTQVGGVLTTKGAYDKAEIQRLQEHVNARHQGPRNAHKFLFLSGDFDLKPFTTSPEQSQFIETRQHAIEEVCRWFGVPPHKIAHLLRSTFNNIEQQGIEFVRDALTPEAEPMAQEADSKLLPFSNRSLITRLDLDWLAEGDAQSKAAADAQETQNGLATINEIRRKRGRNTIGPEGDIVRQQQQMVPVVLAAPEPDPRFDVEGVRQAHLPLVVAAFDRVWRREKKFYESAKRKHSGAALSTHVYTWLLSEGHEAYSRELLAAPMLAFARMVHGADDCREVILDLIDQALAEHHVRALEMLDADDAADWSLEAQRLMEAAEAEMQDADQAKA